METVAQNRNNRLIQRDTRGQRCKEYQHKERDADQRAELHACKYLRHGDEHQTRACVQRFAVTAGECKDCRNNHQTSQQSNTRVEQLNLSDRLLNVLAIRHIGAVGDHDAHGQRHGVEHLTHSTEQGIRGHVGQVRREIVLDAFPCTRTSGGI